MKRFGIFEIYSKRCEYLKGRKFLSDRKKRFEKRKRRKGVEREDLRRESRW
jgi:hypothetical protein